MHHRIGSGVCRWCCLIFGVFFCLWGHQPCWSDTEDDDVLWSFRFDGTPIVDVLNELSETTDVEIFTNRPPENRVLTKTYTNMSLARIIRDLFKGVSFALVWYYNETGLDGIGVWFFDSDQGGYPGTLRNIEDRAVGRPVQRIPRPKQRLPRSFQEEDQPVEDQEDIGIETEVPEEEAAWEREPGETEPEGQGFEEGSDEEPPDEERPDEERPDEER